MEKSMNKIKDGRARTTKNLVLISFVVFYVGFGSGGNLVGHESITVSAQSATPEPTPTPRFDSLVRGDFFAGMLGNKERLDRGMKYCEDILASNPKHADALVWHGGGLLTRAANAYRKGDAKLGDKLWERGLTEMNMAVSLAPDDVGILIGRAATLIGVAQSGWDPADEQGKALLKSALLDYEKVDRIQAPYFSRLTAHSRGELLFGLASGWSILGDQAKARHYLKRIITDVKGTDYELEAGKWLNSNPKAVVQHDCRGCHANR